MKTKNISPFFAIIILIAGILIKVLSDSSTANLDMDIVGFFAGICVGMGAGILIVYISQWLGKRGKKEEEKEE